MRKIVSVLVVIAFLLPLLVSAQEALKECCKLGKEIELEGVTCAKGKTVGSDATAALDCGVAADWCGDAVKKNWGMYCLLNSIYRITDWVSYLIFAIVGVMIIIGAFTIVTAGGSPDKVTSGRNYILYAVMGLVVALFARAIPALVKAIVGM